MRVKGQFFWTFATITSDIQRHLWSVEKTLAFDPYGSNQPNPKCNSLDGPNTSGYGGLIADGDFFS